MSRRAPGLTARAWLGAAVGSAVIHALALWALVGGGAFERSLDRSNAVLAANMAAIAAPAFEADRIDISSAAELQEAPPVTAPPSPETTPPPPGRTAVEADARRDRPVATAVRVAEGRDRAAPSTDQGERAGRTSDGAWRRDRSTMHAELSDGATSSQPARLRTATASPSSPQAVRREPVVGTGDATRSETPASLPSARQLATPDESAAGDSARTADGDRAQPQVVATVEFPRSAESPSQDQGKGPLDAERGARSFDSADRGAPTDDRSQRAASNELHPGIIDLSRAGVRAQDPALSGRGPGIAPGAVDHASRGAAPAELGLPHVQQVGADVAGPTQDRHYDLYIREITRRVNSLRQFPKRLALRLEQGETVVRFVVDVDGRIRSGVHVMKSSGFDEFDLEAARAVERAAPFPPLPPALAAHALPVSMRVAFENPLVR
jgi:TonB family protein